MEKTINVNELFRKLKPGMWIEFVSPVTKVGVGRTRIGAYPSVIECDNDICVRKEGAVTELWDDKRYARKKAISIDKDRCVAQILSVYPRFCVVDLVTYNESVLKVDILRSLTDEEIASMKMLAK